MKVSEFTDSYKALNSADLKKGLVSQHVKRTYASIGKKNAFLGKMLEDCIMTDKNGIPYINMVANKIDFVYALVVLYTDLEPDKNEEDKKDVLKMYDMLQESGAIDDICEQIGSKEINELTFVNKEVLDTWYNAHTTTRAYLATLTEKAVRTFVEVSEILGRDKIDLNPENVMKFMGIT